MHQHYQPRRFFSANSSFPTKKLQNNKHKKEDKTNENVHHHVEGKKPVDLFMFNKFDEYTLGQLLCIYEYKTLFEASFSDINPFDQYGVELGKQIFKKL